MPRSVRYSPSRGARALPDAGLMLWRLEPAAVYALVGATGIASASNGSSLFAALPASRISTSDIASSSSLARESCSDLIAVSERNFPIA